MYRSDMDFQVRQEQLKDWLRQAEHKRLIQAAGLQQPGYGQLLSKMINWLGIQLVKWGAKLQAQPTPSPTGCSQCG